MILKLHNFPRDQRTWNCNLYNAQNDLIMLGVGYHPLPGQFFFVSTKPEAAKTIDRGVTLRLGPAPGPWYDGLTVRECETDDEGYVHCLMDVIC